MVDTSIIMRAANQPRLDLPSIFQRSAESAAAVEQAPLLTRQVEAQTIAQERALQQSQQERQRQDALRKAGVLYNYGSQLKSIPMAQRQTFLNTIPAETLSDLGFDPEKISSIPTDDASITTMLAQLEPIIKQQQGQRSARRSESLAGGRITVQELDDGTVRYLEYGEEIPADQVRSRVAEAQQQFISDQRQLSEGRRGGALEAELEAKPEIERRKTKAVESEKDIQQFISDAVPKIAAIESNISTYNDVVDAIDSGARTGSVLSRLPSITEASKDLDNLRLRLGLDVVSASTFGALSESEMKIALDTALPSTKNPQALRKWVIDKRDAQSKAADAMRDAVAFLNNGGTIAELIELGRQKAPEQADQSNEFEGFEIIE